MNELALFAGAGGSILAGKLLGWRTVCAVESDPYCQGVLLARQQDGCIPAFPIWSDVRTFDGRPWRGIVDCVTAGFPCQPFSLAGERRGADDERNLWPETIRILREVGPRNALLENVPGLLTHEYARTIFGDLAAAGFDAEWDVFSAEEVGAPHLRKRLWVVVSNATNWVVGRRKQFEEGCEGTRNVANAVVERLERFEPAGPETSSTDGPGDGRDSGWWPVEPDVGRVADGVAARVDRLKALGNGWVPTVAVRTWGELTP